MRLGLIIAVVVCGASLLLSQGEGRSTDAVSNHDKRGEISETYSRDQHADEERGDEHEPQPQGEHRQLNEDGLDLANLEGNEFQRRKELHSKVSDRKERHEGVEKADDDLEDAEEKEERLKRKLERRRRRKLKRRQKDKHPPKRLRKERKGKGEKQTKVDSKDAEGLRQDEIISPKEDKGNRHKHHHEKSEIPAASAPRQHGHETESETESSDETGDFFLPQDLREGGDASNLVDSPGENTGRNAWKPEALIAEVSRLKEELLQERTKREQLELLLQQVTEFGAPKASSGATKQEKNPCSDVIEDLKVALEKEIAAKSELAHMVINLGQALSYLSGEDPVDILRQHRQQQQQQQEQLSASPSQDADDVNNKQDEGEKIRHY